MEAGIVPVSLFPLPQGSPTGVARGTRAKADGQSAHQRIIAFAGCPNEGDEGRNRQTKKPIPGLERALGN